MAMTEPQPTPQTNPLIARLKRYLIEWPALLRGLFEDPAKAIGGLPQIGSWERPAVYVVTAGLASGVLQFLYTVRSAPNLAFGALFGNVLAIALGTLVGALLLHVSLTAIARSPGFYRTGYFVALLSLFSPASFVLALIHPLLSIALFGYMLYLLHHYARAAAGLRKEQAIVYVVGLGLLVIVLGRFVGA